MSIDQSKAISEAVGELTRCGGCKGCCREMSTLPIVSDWDVPLHRLVFGRRNKNGRRILKFDEHGTCSHLDQDGNLGCKLHPSHDTKTDGGHPVSWPTECQLYPFHWTADGRMLMFATCEHSGDILKRLMAGEEEASAAVGTLFDLLPTATPPDLQESVAELHKGKWVATIELHDLRHKRNLLADGD